MNRTKLTKKKKLEFLAELERDGNVSRSCRYLGLSRNAVYLHREKDNWFAEQWAIAESRGIDRMIDEARRRAIRGVSKPVYHNGRLIGFEKRYSDTLLMFIVKAHRPEYRDKFVELPPGSKFFLSMDFGEVDQSEDEETPQGPPEIDTGGPDLLED